MVLKLKRLFLLEHNIKEIKEDIGIFGLNIFNLQKAVIPRNKSTSKIALIYFLLNENRSLQNSFDAKIVCSVGNRHIVNWRFFTFLKGKAYYSTLPIMKCLHKRV